MTGLPFLTRWFGIRDIGISPKNWVATPHDWAVIVWTDRLGLVTRLANPLELACSPLSMQYPSFIFSLPLWVRLKTSHLQNAFESQRVALENRGNRGVEKKRIAYFPGFVPICDHDFSSPRIHLGLGTPRIDPNAITFLYDFGCSNFSICIHEVRPTFLITWPTRGFKLVHQSAIYN